MIKEIAISLLMAHQGQIGACWGRNKRTIMREDSRIAPVQDGFCSKRRINTAASTSRSDTQRNTTLTRTLSRVGFQGTDRRTPAQDIDLGPQAHPLAGGTSPQALSSSLSWFSFCCFCCRVRNPTQ